MAPPLLAKALVKALVKAAATLSASTVQENQAPSLAKVKWGQEVPSQRGGIPPGLLLSQLLLAELLSQLLLADLLPPFAPSNGPRLPPLSPLQSSDSGASSFSKRSDPAGLVE